MDKRALVVFLGEKNLIFRFLEKKGIFVLLLLCHSLWHDAWPDCVCDEHARCLGDTPRVHLLLLGAEICANPLTQEPHGAQAAQLLDVDHLRALSRLHYLSLGDSIDLSLVNLGDGLDLKCRHLRAEPNGVVAERDRPCPPQVPGLDQRLWLH